MLLEYAKGARTKAHDKAIVDAIVGKTGAQAEDAARWLRALEDAAGAVNAQRMLILSDDNEDDLQLNGVPVQVRSTAAWLLEQ